MNRIVYQRTVIGCLTLLAFAFAPSTPILASGLTAEVDFGSDRTPITSRNDFNCIASVLQQIVNHRGKTGTNTLYVSQVGVINGNPFIRVYWPEDHSIITVDLHSLPCDNPEYKLDEFSITWYDYKARIDLETGVVPTREDIHGSTYLVDKPWADAVISDCKKNGYKATLKKK